MDRLLQGQGGTLNAYWERDGNAYDPGTVTVQVFTGSNNPLLPTPTLLTSGSASGSGTLGRTFVITPALAANLGYLTVVWTSTVDNSVLTTYAEVVGDFHFSVQFARTRTPLNDTSTYTVQNILDYRTLAEMAIEDICSVAFTPKWRIDQARIVSLGMLEVPRRRIRDVKAIYTQTDSGPVALSNLSGLRIENGGVVFMPSMFNWWQTPIFIAYESGYDSCPYRVRRASLELCRRWLVESPWDERTTGFRTRDGGQMTILTGNHTDAFDIPEVVAIADAYGLPMVA